MMKFNLDSDMRIVINHPLTSKCDKYNFLPTRERNNIFKGR